MTLEKGSSQMSSNEDETMKLDLSLIRLVSLKEEENLGNDHMIIGRVQSDVGRSQQSMASTN